MFRAPMHGSDCLILACILDQGLIIEYFCSISLVIMYLVYYSYSNAGPECQAMAAPI